MLENYSVTQLKIGIIILGILVIVLGSINRLFLENIVMSAIIVILTIVFLIGLVWFSIHSRKITLNPRPRTHKTC
jgi:sensor histidine kinase regulating citrate/malate metabolism